MDIAVEIGARERQDQGAVGMLPVKLLDGREAPTSVQGKQEVTVAAGVFDLDIYPVPQGSQDARPTMGGYPVAFGEPAGAGVMRVIFMGILCGKTSVLGWKPTPAGDGIRAVDWISDLQSTGSKAGKYVAPFRGEEVSRGIPYQARTRGPSTASQDFAGFKPRFGIFFVKVGL